jgi:transposase
MSLSTWHRIASLVAMALSRRIAAGAVEAIAHEILKAKARLGLPPDAPVMSCYEAGREAFWLHRVIARRTGNLALHAQCQRSH